MARKILVINGDNYGRTVIGAAEKVLRSVAPDLEIVHGKMGAEAYESTGYAMPPATMDLITECDALLVGPLDMKGVPERDPLAAIQKQMGLYLQYREYFPLCDYLGKGSVDVVVLSPAPDSTMVVHETESIDGISSEEYTDSDRLREMLSETLKICELKDGRKISAVADGILFKSRENRVDEVLGQFFADTEFRVKRTSTGEMLYTMVQHGAEPAILLCDIPSAACIQGLAAGIVGGSGLMPCGYLGRDLKLFTVAPIYHTEAVGRELNPTSAILSAACMLLTFGMDREYQLIRSAVCEMYRSGRTTPDVGGHLSADKFAQGVNEIIHMNMHS
jgi:isocitrate/isopropylmalate dehydrogenase